ncbi:MAG: tetratricopeptide repeat protein [Dongiaceae bacterium]
MSRPALAAAVAAFQNRRLSEAVTLCEAILAERPEDAEALHLLGVVLQTAGRGNDAATLLARAAGLAPDNADIQRNLGAVLASLGRLSEAIPALEKAHSLRPDDPAALENLATALQQSRQEAHAVALLEPWLQRHPGEARLWHRLGILLLALDRRPAAIKALERCLALQPQHGEANKALGRLRVRQREFAAAADCFRRAIAADPADAEAHRYLADILSIQCRIAESIPLYRRAQALKPDPGIDFVLAANFPAILPSTAAIDEIRERYDKALDRLIEVPPKLEDPSVEIGETRQFYLAYHGRNDRAPQQKLAAAYLAACPSLAWRAPYLDGWRPRDRLRIGVVSTYLRHHTVGLVTQGLLDRFDRERFEILLFRPRSAGDATSQAIAGTADAVIDIPDRLAEARLRIAAAELDLLYFPDIGMASLTYFLAFARLAPVQCIGWGHPDTTGIPNADYWLSAADWEPPDGDEHYSEQLIRLRHPPVYYPRPLAVPPKRSRADLGLPAQGRLYLSPMSLFKFHPEFDKVVGRILEQDLDAHLVLSSGDASEWNELLRARIAQVSANAARRLIFLPRKSFADFQALGGLGDAFLDPLHFGGGRTSLDLLGLGVPIVNRPGRFMRSRITYGFYRQMGMTDLVAADEESYVATALRLARDADWRQAMRDRTAERSAVLYENEAAPREVQEFFAAAVAAAAAGSSIDRWPPLSGG